MRIADDIGVVHAQYSGKRLDDIDYAFACIGNQACSVASAAFRSTSEKAGDIVIVPSSKRVACVEILGKSARVAIMSFDCNSITEDELVDVAQRSLEAVLPAKACYILGSYKCGSLPRLVSSRGAPQGNVRDAFPPLEPGMAVDGLEAALFTECTILGVHAHLLVCPRDDQDSSGGVIAFLRAASDAIRDELPSFCCNIELAERLATTTRSSGAPIGYA